MAKKSYPSRRRELVVFGRRLRSWRKAKGWSQEKLALTAGLDFSYVNEIENGKLNPGLLTILILSKALEITPAALFLPPTEAKRIQKSPLVQADLRETHLTPYLEQPEFIEAHCQLVINYAKQGEWKGAQTWLQALHQLFPDNRYLAYTQARYHCLKLQKIAAPVPTLPNVAQPVATYAQVRPEFETELQEAFHALEEALTEPTLWEKIKDTPDFEMLQQHGPEAWYLLTQHLGQGFG